MKLRSESGQALVEVALSLSLFLMMVFVSCDFAYLFYSKLTLQNAVRQAARYAITGQCKQSGSTCSLSRYNSIVDVLQQYSAGLLNSGNVGDIRLSCTSQGGGCPNNAGGPGDIVTITVTYPYPFITPMLKPFFTGNSYTIKVATSFKNEPFPPGAS